MRGNNLSGLKVEAEQRTLLDLPVQNREQLISEASLDLDNVVVEVAS